MSGIFEKMKSDLYFDQMFDNFGADQFSPASFNSNFFSGSLGNQLLSSLGSGLTSAVGGLPGSFLGLGTGLIGSHIQNRQQERFYQQYMSPSARMRDMTRAGINPAAAAQGIAGAASSPQMAAAPVDQGVSSSLAQTGASAASQKSFLDAQITNLNQNTQKQAAETTGQNIENMFSPQKAQATINNLVSQGQLTTKQAALLQKDLDHWDELFKLNTDKIRSEIDVLKKEFKKMDSEIALNGALKSEAQKRTDKLQYLNEFLMENGYELEGIESRIYKFYADGDDQSGDALLDAVGKVGHSNSYNMASGQQQALDPYGYDTQRKYNLAKTARGRNQLCDELHHQIDTLQYQLSKIGIYYPGASKEDRDQLGKEIFNLKKQYAKLLSGDIDTYRELVKEYNIMHHYYTNGEQWWREILPKYVPQVNVGVLGGVGSTDDKSGGKKSGGKKSGGSAKK